MSRLNLSRRHSYDPPIVLLGAANLIFEGPALKARVPAPPNGDATDEVFVIRLQDGSLRGYFNRCTHVTVPMDYDDGAFFDGSGLIMCRVHGARYDPETGEAVLGPGRGSLTTLILEEQGDQILIHGWERIVR